MSLKLRDWNRRILQGDYVCCIKQPDPDRSLHELFPIIHFDIMHWFDLRCFPNSARRNLML